MIRDEQIIDYLNSIVVGPVVSIVISVQKMGSTIYR
jgi:hypothetical protein